MLLDSWVDIKRFADGMKNLLDCLAVSFDQL